jgi:hypothetical protein
MKKLIFFLFCIIGLAAAANAQGLDLDEEAAIYKTVQVEPEVEGAKDDNLPLSVDLSPFCPQVRNQGEAFSCVGWSVGYAAMTIQRAALNNWRDKQLITANANSALFVYNQIKKGPDCNRGSRIADALALLVEKGNCLSRDFDSDAMACAKMPTPAQMVQAKNFVISDFLAVFPEGSNDFTKIRKLKESLARNAPVVVGMSVLKNFYQLSNAKFWFPDIGNQTPAGGHALTVVGYDDKQGAFRIVNSWGTAWADRGFVWIKYDDFAKYCKYAYQLVISPDFGAGAALAQASLTPDSVGGGGRAASTQAPPTNDVATEATNQSTAEQPVDAVQQPTDTRQQQSPPPRRVSGSFAFKSFEGWSENNRAILKTAEVDFDKGHYRTTDLWALGTRFQFMATTRVINQYVYVFSIDSENKIQIHWPRQYALNNKFNGLNESALVASKDTRVVVPGFRYDENNEKIYTFLKLAQPGKDRLCVLFSKKKLGDINQICNKMAQGSGDVLGRLRALLGDRLIPEADIRYENGRIAFDAATRSDGYIVPIILEVETAQ